MGVRQLPHLDENPQNSAAPEIEPEWLVADHRGAFAMGTVRGFRTRKYHGFYLTIAGRSETAYLCDLELICNGQSLWPHAYGSDRGTVIHPEPAAEGLAPASRQTDAGPEWKWSLEGGKLTFTVEAEPAGGIRLGLRWQSPSREAAQLLIRPFWGMRPLHATGGADWRASRDTMADWGEEGGSVPAGPAHRLRIHSAGDVGGGGCVGEEVFCRVEGPLQWIEELPLTYYRFRLDEEARRGYPAEENLHARGFWEGKLRGGEFAALVVSESPEDLASSSPGVNEGALAIEHDGRVPALDFAVTRPAGIVAGFPWFGEWGRDTFISLPGIAAAWLRARPEDRTPAEHGARVSAWVQEVLDRWSGWIADEGMLPNLIESCGTPQWQSADATLWWCHSLACLWQLSLTEDQPFKDLSTKYRPLLDAAIESISTGRHRFLKPSADADGGLLEVTEGHATWMDARVGGEAVTPRTGRLPEINALWFQARALQALWSDQPTNPRSEDSLEMLQRIGSAALTLDEPGRPNTVFLHSIPLAPSFVLGETRVLNAQLDEIAAKLWTPVGLRTLDPADPRYRARCEGPQLERDQAYHQGTVWGWLGGHYDMARVRANANANANSRRGASARAGDAEALASSIRGQIAEIYDGDAPHTPRGAPAQAWSVACAEEARARRALHADNRLSELLDRRWPGRRDGMVSVTATTNPLSNSKARKRKTMERDL